ARRARLRPGQRIRRHLHVIPARRGHLCHSDRGTGHQAHRAAGQGGLPLVNLAILVAGTILAILAARPQSSSALRRAATGALFLLMLVVPAVSRTPSVVFDALTAMCVAYGWNFIGGYTGYASFGNVAYLGLGAFVAAGFMS